jgi:ATP-dependent Lon protease
VPTPTFEQARNVARSIYRHLLSEHRWRFEGELSSDCLDIAAKFSPREMRRRLLDAMGNAKVSGRDKVAVDDFGKTAVARKATIGFVAA